ncbi:protein max [Anopheles funestus]|uniref:Protein max n=1 Tax=Anopheles funestus TaxID=62324 RepID=A0A182R380_ANOFN|nr:protein max [Anopheles funestus]
MRLHEDNQGRKLSTSEWYDNMSDDDRDIDIESDDGDDSDNTKSQSRSGAGSQFYSQAEKRAHHNALERKRRDHIKDSFTALRDSVPSLQGEKASRAQILKKAAEYIQFMRRKNNSHQHDIDDLRRQNNKLETEIRDLELARASGKYGDGADLGGGFQDGSRGSDSSDIDEVPKNNNIGLARRNKKMKTNANY